MNCTVDRWLSGATKAAERKLADKTLRHSGQGLMAWAASNALVEPKGSAIVSTNQASGLPKSILLPSGHRSS